MKQQLRKRQLSRRVLSSLEDQPKREAAEPLVSPLRRVSPPTASLEPERAEDMSPDAQRTRDFAVAQALHVDPCAPRAPSIPCCHPHSGPRQRKPLPAKQWAAKHETRAVMANAQVWPDAVPVTEAWENGVGLVGGRMAAPPDPPRAWKIVVSRFSALMPPHVMHAQTIVLGADLKGSPPDADRRTLAARVDTSSLGAEERVLDDGIARPPPFQR
jgi:hypothetical protein